MTQVAKGSNASKKFAWTLRFHRKNEDRKNSFIPRLFFSFGQENFVLGPKDLSGGLLRDGPTEADCKCTGCEGEVRTKAACAQDRFRAIVVATWTPLRAPSPAGH